MRWFLLEFFHLYVFNTGLHLILDSFGSSFFCLIFLLCSISLLLQRILGFSLDIFLHLYGKHIFTLLNVLSETKDLLLLLLFVVVVVMAAAAAAVVMGVVVAAAVVLVVVVVVVVVAAVVLVVVAAAAVRYMACASLTL
jgi:hypothetical protein